MAPIEVEDSDAFRRVIKRVPHGLVLGRRTLELSLYDSHQHRRPRLDRGQRGDAETRLANAACWRTYGGGFPFRWHPEDVFQNVFLDHATTSGLIADRAFGFVNFTGSVGGGKAMEAAASGTFTGIGLELGGKDPGYVMEDANLDAAVDTLIDGAMFNSGQCCCGIERIYVHESLFDAFVEKAVAIVNGYKLGNPLDAETTIGPMAHVRFADEVRAQTAEAIADGAKAHIDPADFPQDSGAYLMPQILTNVTHDMRVMREESFGPLLASCRSKTTPKRSA